MIPLWFLKISLWSPYRYLEPMLEWIRCYISKDFISFYFMNRRKARRACKGQRVAKKLKCREYGLRWPYSGQSLKRLGHFKIKGIKVVNQVSGKDGRARKCFRGGQTNDDAEDEAAELIGTLQNLAFSLKKRFKATSVCSHLLLTSIFWVSLHAFF